MTAVAARSASALAALVIGLAACPGPNAPPSEDPMTAHCAPDPLVTLFLPRLPGTAKAEPLLTELVADWRREAGDDPDAADILALLQDELDAALAPLAPAERLDHVFAEVIDRRLRQLSRRSWAAGKGLAEGRLGDEAARTEGRAVLAATEALAPEVRAVQGPLALSLRQALEDVLLEGLYLVERKAMSRRFAELFAPDAP